MLVATMTTNDTIDITEIDGSLGSMQSLVGGLIQPIGCKGLVYLLLLQPRLNFCEGNLDACRQCRFLRTQVELLRSCVPQLGIVVYRFEDVLGRHLLL